MQFNVAQLLKEPTGSAREYTINEPFDRKQQEYVGVQRVKGKVQFIHTDRGVWVEGELESEGLSICSRCLSEFSQPIPLHINEEYFLTRDVLTGLPIKKPEAGSFNIDESHVLDLTEAVRQYSIANTPMKSLCRPDCKGICVGCGSNLNESPCKCSKPDPDAIRGNVFSLASYSKGKRRG